MSIKATRACVDAVLDGSINKTHFTKEPVRDISWRLELPLAFFSTSCRVHVDVLPWARPVRGC